MARTLLVIGLLASLVFGWHLYAASDVRRHAEDLRAKNAVSKPEDPVQVNPVTDVVTIPIASGPPKGESGNPFEALGKALGSMLGGALAKALEPSFERDLNLRAREFYDLYAMLLPYRVHVLMPEGKEEQSASR